MVRAGFALFVAAVALAIPLGSGAAADRAGAPSAGSADAPGTITIRARTGEGAWRPGLSLQLHKLKLTPFSVCALWNKPAGAPWSVVCHADAAAHLPAGTVMRLEQNPIRLALKRDDSPGWGMLAVSDQAELEAVLSNTITGNTYGTLHYRVTLRDSAGKVLATSNTIKLVWHR